MQRRHLLRAGLLAAPLLGTARPPALAQGTGSYPVREIRLITPYPAGGGTDLISRIVGKALAESWRQPVVVDNRPGASGILGTRLAAAAPPNGYTLLSASFGQGVSALLYKDANYDLFTDFVPVILMSTLPNLLVVNPALGVSSLRELLARAKREPDRLTYATIGVGSSPHLASEALKDIAQVRMRDIPYAGSAPAITDVIGGQVDMMVDSLTSSLPHVRDGRLKALAITAGTRSPLLPDVPTLAEAGIPDFEINGWFGILAPKGTPPEVVARWNTETNRVLRDPAVWNQLEAMGMERRGGPPEALTTYLRNEVARWSALANRIGLKPQ
ncbi:Bug family tripartite tricarboxylate transporter substrate binding protein [Roseomonas sp. BN140053]|uniref:Bug family tripartite tricarboxylate transporter substrate binding protein n=1 Tax=Roseomonas sp. BN140053 TaxID=3391898 RepID=UPI0039E9124D